MAKKISKGAKRRLTIITPIVFLAVGYCIFTAVTTAIQLYQLNHEEKQLKQELKDLKGDSENLKTEITKLQDKDYVARYARENYLYTKDGEYVIKVNGDDQKKEKAKLPVNEDYIVYGSLAVGILVILYIIVKNYKRKKANKKKKKK